MRERIEELKQKYSEGYRYWDQGDHYVTEAEYVDLILEGSAVGYISISFAIDYFKNEMIFQQI